MQRGDGCGPGGTGGRYNYRLNKESCTNLLSHFNSSFCSSETYLDLKKKLYQPGTNFRFEFYHSATCFLFGDYETSEGLLLWNYLQDICIFHMRVTGAPNRSSNV